MFKLKNSFFKKNADLIFGIILTISHSLMWFFPAFFLGSTSISNYSFISIFPMWFIYSIFGSFILIILLIIVFIYFT